MTFPPPHDEDEEAFVLWWAGRDDRDGLVEVIAQALAERRPRLAARLVALLEDEDDAGPGSPIARARRAASLLVVSSPRPDGPGWVELDEAFAEFRRRRMRRLRARYRRYDPDGRRRR